MDTLFCTLDSARIAEVIRTVEQFVCYAGPGIQLEPAKAMAAVAKRLGAETITLCVDFDERVVRMGYGDMEAMKCLHEAGR